MKKFPFEFLLGSVLALASPGVLAISGSAIHGQVLNGRDGQPIPNALVIVTWRGISSAALVVQQSVCYHVETARSDSAGKFSTPAWSTGTPMDYFFISQRDTTIDAFVPGFLKSPHESWKNNELTMMPFEGSAVDFFTEVKIGKVAGCGRRDGSSRNMYSFYDSIVEAGERLLPIDKQEDLLRQSRRSRDESLLNNEKPSRSLNGKFVNDNPNDSYKKEDVAK
jgi:hypothetical protein